MGHQLEEAQKQLVQLLPRATQTAARMVQVGNLKFDDQSFVIIVGLHAPNPHLHSEPEHFSTLIELSLAAKTAGAHMLKIGHMFNNRGTNRIAKEIKAATGLPIVSEVCDSRCIDFIAEHVDVFEVGSRNMYNYELLKSVGKYNKPTILKRSIAATIAEWLQAAEYILAQGNPDVVICEGGIRTFETLTGITLDLSGALLAKALTHLPVIIDPSHACSSAQMVLALAKASLMAGADGLVIELHPGPGSAQAAHNQLLSPKELATLVKDLKRLTPLVNKRLSNQTRLDNAVNQLN